MSTRTSFDTRRLDEECVRAAARMLVDDAVRFAPRPAQVKALLLGYYATAGLSAECAQAVFDQCRRPKAIPASEVDRG